MSDDRFWHGFYTGIALGVVMHIAFLVFVFVEFFGFPALPTYVIGGLLAGGWGVFAQHRLAGYRSKK